MKILETMQQKNEESLNIPHIMLDPNEKELTEQQIQALNTDVDQLSGELSALQDSNWSQEAHILDLDGQILQLRSMLQDTTDELTRVSEALIKAESMRMPADLEGNCVAF